MLRRRFRPRREGSLAATVVQSMALAVMGTAAAYPSWVLVEGEEQQFVLGVAWVISRDLPPPGSPLLGPVGVPLMLGIAFCCFFSVLSGTLALMLDFLGRREFRSAAPLLHALAAVLSACAAALGSCLLGQLRVRVRTQPELRGLAVRPGQSLFLACLACALAATAAGLSCSSPARVEPARSSWDLQMSECPSFRSSYRSSFSSEDSFEAPPPSLSLRDDDGSLSDESPSERVIRYVNQAFGHLQRRDPQQQPEEGHGSGQEPKLEGKWSTLKRYWDSAFVLMTDFFQGTLSAPHLDETNRDRGPAAQQGVPFNIRPDSERRAHLESEARSRTLEGTSRI